MFPPRFKPETLAILDNNVLNHSASFQQLPENDKEWSTHGCLDQVTSPKTNPNHSCTLSTTNLSLHRKQGDLQMKILISKQSVFEVSNKLWVMNNWGVALGMREQEQY
jgi:hypothetical protein